MISLVYSSSPQYDCYGNFEELLKQEFRKQGIEPIFDKFYLDFNTVTPEDGIKIWRRILVSSKINRWR